MNTELSLLVGSLHHISTIPNKLLISIEDNGVCASDIFYPRSLLHIEYNLLFRKYVCSTV